MLKNRFCSATTVWLFLVFLAGAQDVVPLLSLTGTAWRYEAQGLDLGTGWREPAFNDASWSTGSALLGTETSSPYPYPVPIATPLPTAGGRITYYFRTRFDWTGGTSGVRLLTTNFIDDGAVFYLNGIEAARRRMPSGPINFHTRASVQTAEGLVEFIELQPDALREGQNVLAVEVHQNAPTSSDLIFGLSLHAIRGVAPRILDPTEPSDRDVPQSAATLLQVVATGEPAPTYQWFQDTGSGPRSIAGAIGSTYLIPNMMAADAGRYFARVSNSLGVVFSRTGLVTFLADTIPPAVLAAVAGSNAMNITVMFSEPVNASPTEIPFNWQIRPSDGGDPIQIKSAEALSETTLLLSIPPLAEGVAYTLVVDVVEDRFGNFIASGTEVPLARFATPVLAISSAQVWQYEASGAELGTNWRQKDFDASNWARGPSLHAFINCVNCLPAPIRTPLRLTNDAGSPVQTYYFRTGFRFAGDSRGAVLRLRPVLDDGAVFYLNGVEIFRRRMPAGAITHATSATAPPVSVATFEGPFDVGVTNLLVGQNVLAVEVHQQGVNSPDVVFGTELSVVTARLMVEEPQLQFERSAGQITLIWQGENLTLQQAEQVTGPWNDVLGANSPLTVTAGGTSQFFRLIRP